METIRTILLFIHVAAGATALLTGIGALALVFKPDKHTKVGKVFFSAMLVVFITALYLSIVGSLLFLLAIAVLSFFSTFFGVRSMQFYKGKRIQWYDHFALAVLALMGVFLLGSGVYHGLASGISAAIVLHLVFGGFMVFLSFVSINDILRLPSGDQGWFKSHRGNMAGAIIATITAFCTTALDFLPTLVAWIGPALIFTPIFSYLIKRTNKRFKLN